MNPAKAKEKSSAGVVDTGGEFATGVNDTGGKFCQRYRRQIQICHGGKQWEQHQTADNLKEKIYLYANSTIPRESKRKNENFSDRRFFPFATSVGGAP